MRKHVIVALTSFVAAHAYAQPEDVPAPQQLSTTQMHLQMMRPASSEPQAAGGKVLGRLAGKVLSQQFKDVHLGDEGRAQAQNERELQAPGWHFNRRAEICYDNYRFGMQRGGMRMSYERNF